MKLETFARTLFNTVFQILNCLTQTCCFKKEMGSNTKAAMKSWGIVIVVSLGHIIIGHIFNVIIIS